MRSLLCTLVLMTAALSSLADYNPEVKTQGTVNTNELVVFADRSGRFIKSGGRVITNMFSGSGTTGLVTSTTATGKYLKDDGTWGAPGDVKADGSVPMTGPLLMGGNDISNCPTLTAINRTATNALDIAGSALQFSTSASQVTNQMQVLVQAYSGASGAGTYNYVSNNVQGPVFMKDVSNFLAVNGSGWSFYDGEPAVGATTYSAQYLTDQFLPDFGAPGYLMAGYTVTTNTIRTFISQASIVVTNYATADRGKDATNALARVSILDTNVTHRAVPSTAGNAAKLSVTGDLQDSQYPLNITPTALSVVVSDGFGKIDAGYIPAITIPASSVTNVLGSWGTGIDRDPTNAVDNTYWSSAFQAPATLKSIKAKLGSGSLVCNIIRQPYNNALGTYTTVYTGVTVSATATNITLNTAVAAGECVGFVVTNTVTATNFWGSLEYTLL